MSSVAIAKVQCSSNVPLFTAESKCSACKPDDTFIADCNGICGNSVSSKSCTNRLPAIRQKRGTSWDTPTYCDENVIVSPFSRSFEEKVKRPRIQASFLGNICESPSQAQASGYSSPSCRFSRSGSFSFLSDRGNGHHFSRPYSSEDAASESKHDSIGPNFGDCHSNGNHNIEESIVDVTDDTRMFESSIYKKVEDRRSYSTLPDVDFRFHTAKRALNKEAEAASISGGKQVSYEGWTSLASAFTNHRNKSNFVALWSDAIMDTLQSVQSLDEAREKLKFILTDLVSQMDVAVNECGEEKLPQCNHCSTSLAEVQRLSEEKESWVSSMKLMNELLTNSRVAEVAKCDEINRLKEELADSKVLFAQLQEKVKSYIRSWNMTVPNRCGLNERSPPDVC